MRKLRRFLGSDAFVGYVFIAPWLFGFITLSIVPMLTSLVLSFTRFNIINTPQFIGFDNFVRMFTNDPRFLTSLRVTFYFVFVSVPLRVGFALVVALLMNHKARVYNFYRSVYYLPSIIGGSIAVSMMWRELFATNGAVNAFLGMIGLPSETRWLGMPNTSIYILLTLSVWQFGSSMIIFAAGLKQIPETYYEAAMIDGANSFRKFISITLPILSPVIFFNLVMQTIGGFMTFTQAFVITAGGPLDSTLFYALYIYIRAFQFNEMGYASALSWVLLVIVALATALIFKSSKACV